MFSSTIRWTSGFQNDHFKGCLQLFFFSIQGFGTLKGKKLCEKLCPKHNVPPSFRFTCLHLLLILSGVIPHLNYIAISVKLEAHWFHDFMVRSDGVIYIQQAPCFSSLYTFTVSTKLSQWNLCKIIFCLQGVSYQICSSSLSD